MVVSFRCPRLPWGLREGWRQKYFCYLNHSMGTQGVNMRDCGSTLLSPETIFDEAVGHFLGCWYSPLTLHYYRLIYQIFKILNLYQKNVLEHSVKRQRPIITFLMLLAYLFVGVLPLRFLRLASDRCWVCWPTVFVPFAVCHWFLWCLPYAAH